MIGDRQNCTVLSSHTKQWGRIRKVVDLFQHIYGTRGHRQSFRFRTLTLEIDLFDVRREIRG